MPKNASSPAGGLLGGGIGAGEHHDVGIEMGFFIHEDQKDDADDDATDDGQRDQAGGQNDAHGDGPEEEGDVRRHTNVTGGEDKRLTGVLKK